MASKKFKMIVPKAGTSNKLGSELRLYELDEVVEVKEDWQEDLMNAFIENGFAIEVKMDSADSSADMEAEIKEDEDPERARNDKGHFLSFYLFYSSKKHISKCIPQICSTGSRC